VLLIRDPNFYAASTYIYPLKLLPLPQTQILVDEQFYHLSRPILLPFHTLPSDAAHAFNLLEPTMWHPILGKLCHPYPFRLLQPASQRERPTAVATPRPAHPRGQAQHGGAGNGWQWSQMDETLAVEDIHPSRP
jgi:hypothetical protein